MRFPIVVHKDAESSYGVIVPDLPGCFSGGDTLDEAVEMAHEAVICHVGGLLEHGDRIPKQLPLEIHHKNPDFADGIWALIDVDLSQACPKTVDVSLTIPSHILDLIDDIATQDGESRSGLVARAVLEYAWIRVEDK